MASALAAMRGLYCDCEIVLAACTLAPAPTTDDVPATATTPARLLGHRAVLAQAAYFAMLFARADPDRIDLGHIEGERVLRAVYVIHAPFSADVLAFLVDRLYGNHNHDPCRDPVAAVGAALFLGMPGTCAQDIMAESLRLLAGDLAPTASPTRCDMALDPVSTKSPTQCWLAHFVAHMLVTDIPTEAKAALAARFAYLLPSTASTCVTGQPDSMCHYRRHAPTCDSATTTKEDGFQWHLLGLSADMTGTGVDRVEWDGLVFGVGLVFRSAPDGTDDIVLSFSCTPATEQLGSWTWGDPQPAGMVDVIPRAVRVGVRLYHPMQGILETNTLTSWSSAPIDVNLHRCRSRSYAAATGNSRLPKGAILVPNGVDRTTRGAARPAERVARTATLFVKADPRDRCLWACEVDVALQEPPIDPGIAVP
ncbi:hypothetical protein pqer_cds_341 [Pandoravirus quercus]|uniref:BTB domain containing protein n=2 Tax=Pandoravirus TaxID=2060084 RepID=A0A2U7U8K7_9VIRU|nr:hypothetical protein pqer_cds_341 [Pandoravirus quercus]AVK74763.1 hypothetical protein pqer_cds_341 [Pandoravirus quercus]QBZ80940.1 hypothetical protein pclt_cds_342 [Pandoravirus celtis]